MALRYPVTPEAPEEEKNPAARHYSEDALSPLERGRAGGYYAKNQDEIDARRRSLKNSEDDAGKTSDEAGTAGDVGEKERQGGWSNKVTPQENRSQRKPFSLKGALTMTSKKKGPMAIIVVILSLLGFGGAFWFGAALAPLMAVHNITNDLNDQLSAVELRSDKLLRLKFGTGDSLGFGCTGVGSVLPVKCNYRTISKSYVEKLKAVGIEVEGDTGGVFGNKIKPKTYKFQNKVLPADQFAQALKTDRALSRAYFKAGNMKWLSLKGTTHVNGTLAKFGLSEADPKLSGSHEDRVNKLMTRSGAASINEVKFTQVIDPETGEPTDRWTLNGDPSGETFSSKQVEVANKSLEGVKAVSSAPSKIASTAFKSLNVIGFYDVACSIVQKVGTASVAAKVANSAQLAEYAQPVATLAGMMQAGAITPEDGQVLQEFFNSTDSRQTMADVQGILDGNDNATKENPNYGKNAMDSELYKMSAGGGVAATSLTDKSYSLGFGTTKLLNGAATFAGVAKNVLDLGDLNGCKYVQSWWVRGGGLVVGIIAGIFSGGSSIAANAIPIVAMTVGMYALDHILNSALSGSIIGETMGETPVERGTAFWTGMSVILGQTAQLRGMKPGTAEEIVAYQRDQSEVKAKYLAYERGASNPFDVSNPYSITGTLALALNDRLPSSITSAELSKLPSDLSSFVFGGLGSILLPSATHAASSDPERFKQCDDQSYNDIGIDADVQCNIRYVMPESSMKLEPMDVALYMEGNNPEGIQYVEPDTTTGLPKDYKLPTTDGNQNIAISLLKGVTSSVFNDREYKNDYSKFLDFCVYRVLPFGETFEEEGAFGDPGEGWKSGKKCLEDEEKFHYFRMYTFDRSVNDDIDNSPVKAVGSSPVGLGGARITLEQLKALISSYSLPPATADGVNGYDALLKNLTDNPDATWAASELLAGEKAFIDKGGDLKEYLNTTWIWFENGSSKWPDPYQINCNDNRAGYTSEVSFFCGVVNFQIAGYQAENRKNDYVDMYKKFYSDSELPSVLQKVVDTSSKASEDKWDYKDAGQQKGLVSSYLSSIGSATINDISPNQQFFDQKAQFLTLILGKDPKMATALNSFAVSDSDIIYHLKNRTENGCGVSWAHYICERERQLMSNMIMALYLFDSRNGVNNSGAPGGGVGFSAIWGGQGDPLIYEFGPDSDNGLYGYGTDYGLNGLQHTGADVVLDPEAPLYSPVSGTIRCAGTGNGTGTKGGGCSAFNDYFGAGNGRIEIEMDNGYVLILGHTSTSKVTVGQRVAPNQQVGTNGGMNSWHVHVECRTPEPSLPAGWRIVDPKVCTG